MSTLWDAVKDRYDAQALVELTQHRDVAATTIDDTYGERAVDGIVALFPTYVQEAFDDTSAAHILIGVEGVIALLFKWGGTTHRVAQVRWEDWLEQARAFRSAGPRARIVPETSVPASKAPSDPPSTPHTPWSDDRRFEGLSPRHSGGAGFPSDPDY